MCLHLYLKLNNWFCACICICRPMDLYLKLNIWFCACICICICRLVELDLKLNIWLCACIYICISWPVHLYLKLNIFVYIWAKISSVPDTSVTDFVLHSLNQFTDETKQCMPVQINTGAKFCSTISFWYAVWFFELSWDKGCVSSGHLKYHAKKNRGKKNITAKPFKYLWYHLLVTFLCTSFQYPALFWNPISIPI